MNDERGLSTKSPKLRNSIYRRWLLNVVKAAGFKDVARERYHSSTDSVTQFPHLQ